MKLYTIEGLKNISTIKIGDLILSYNEETKKEETNKVLNIFKKYVDETIEIRINNEIIKVDKEHPFYNGKEYIKAIDLKQNDKVYDGNNYYEIEDIKVSNNISELYKITVENNHNYYIGESHILVHNEDDYLPSRLSGTYNPNLPVEGENAVDEEAERLRRIAELREEIARREEERAELLRQNECYNESVEAFRLGLKELEEAVGGEGYSDIIDRVLMGANDAVKAVNDTEDKIKQLDGDIERLYSSLSSEGCDDKRDNVPAAKHAETIGVNKIGGNDLIYDPDKFDKAYDLIRKGIDAYSEGNRLGNKGENATVTNIANRLNEAREILNSAKLEYDKDLENLKGSIPKSPFTYDPNAKIEYPELRGDTAWEQIIHFYEDLEYPNEAIAGMLGCIQDSTAFINETVGDGEYAFNIIQCNNEPRKGEKVSMAGTDKFIRFIADEGFKADDLRGSLAYIDHMLRDTVVIKKGGTDEYPEVTLYDVFTSRITQRALADADQVIGREETKGAGTAANYFTSNICKPAQGDEKRSHRITKAEEYYSYMLEEDYDGLYAALEAKYNEVNPETHPDIFNRPLYLRVQNPDDPDTSGFSLTKEDLEKVGLTIVEDPMKEFSDLVPAVSDPGHLTAVIMKSDNKTESQNR